MELIPEILGLKITDVAVIFGTVSLIANLNSHAPALNGKGVGSQTGKIGGDGILDGVDGGQDAYKRRDSHRYNQDRKDRPKQIAPDRLKSDVNILDYKWL
jgi:hypothetical protein